MNTVGEPYSGKPNVRFDEGRLARHGGPAAYSTGTTLSAYLEFGVSVDTAGHLPCSRRSAIPPEWVERGLPVASIDS